MISKFAPKGAIDREILAAVIAEGLTLRQIAERTDRSIATVRYWIERHGLTRTPVGRATRRPDDPASAPRVTTMDCGRHGTTDFVLEGRGRYRCKRCRQDQVAEWRRRVKRRLVEEAGGRCVVCGYDRCTAALQFHHLDPASKSFALSHRGLARALAKVRAEAAKCVLLCATCHAEVEAGFTTLPVARDSSPGRIRTSKN